MVVVVSQVYIYKTDQTVPSQSVSSSVFPLYPKRVGKRGALGFDRGERN